MSDFGTARGIAPMACNALLALLSLAAGLAACEVALRLFYPRYELAAQPPRKAWDLHDIHHQRAADPDTRTQHLLIYNNLDGRQSRDFPAGSLEAEDAVNIAFFGDSTTENIRMPAQYSYTEFLDFLLNANRRSPSVPNKDPRPERLFNVLNFGVEGYGPRESYLRWRDLPVRNKLHHVFYMVCINELLDLKRDMRRGMLWTDEAGEVQFATEERLSVRAPAWKRLLARLHLTYAAIDAWRRLAPTPTDAFGQPDHLSASQAREFLPLFATIVRRWRREVEADGARFHMVLPPRNPNRFPGFRSPRNDAEARVFDLLECFEGAIPDYDVRDWQFENDWHLTAAANMVASTCLYRYLEDALDLGERSAEELARARSAYYQAFLDSSAWLGERYMPDARWLPSSNEANESSEAKGEAIVAKYLALELLAPAAARWREAVGAAREAGPLAMAAWTLYANVRERLLVYVKSPCPANWRPAGRFFLHVVPFTPEKVPPDRRRYGFVNLDHAPFLRPIRQGNECISSVPLPDYPLASARTGAFVTRQDQGGNLVYTNLWSAEFRMPLARGPWNVYADASGRGLEYVSSPCGPTDTRDRFFLHVYPLVPADLRDSPASGILRRYANLEFQWSETGVRTEGECRATVALPNFPIDLVRTGQFHGGVLSSKRLWSARIDLFEVERVGARPLADLADGP